MEEKRKISIRKILQMALTIVGAVGCIIAMVSASSLEGEKPLKKLPVLHIRNDRKYHSTEQRKIMDLAIYDRNVDILHTPVSRIDVHGIEQAIKSDPWVADAQVYIDIDRVMQIYVTRRVPVARIFRKDGESYYVDSTLHTMPLSDDYTYYTTVVTNAPDMGNDSAGKSILKQIVTLVKAINADSFWNAQVSQVSMDSAGMFELMPVLGNQKIKIGDTSRLKEKFGNLLAFYKNVLNRIGWDKYDVLDARFHDQVIASPSLPYNGPRDLAISKMNWITSIETTEAQKFHEDSVRAAETKIAAIAAAKAESIERAKKKAAAVAAAAAAAKAAAKAAAPKRYAGKTAKDLKKDKKKEKVDKKSLKTAAAAHKVGDKAAHTVTKAAATGKNKPAPKHDAKGTKAPPAKTAKKEPAKAVAAQKHPAKKDVVKTAQKKPGAHAASAAHPAAKASAKKAPPAKPNKKDDKKKPKTKADKEKDKKKDKKETGKHEAAGKYTYPAAKGH